MTEDDESLRRNLHEEAACKEPAARKEADDENA
jgi:hypothetical protein